MNCQKIHEKKTIIREIEIKPQRDMVNHWNGYAIDWQKKECEDMEYPQLTLMSLWQPASLFLSLFLHSFNFNLDNTDWISFMHDEEIYAFYAFF